MKTRSSNVRKALRAAIEQAIRDERDEALLRQALEALKAENEMLREALKDAEVKQGEVK